MARYSIERTAICCFCRTFEGMIFESWCSAILARLIGHIAGLASLYIVGEVQTDPPGYAGTHGDTLFFSMNSRIPEQKAGCARTRILNMIRILNRILSTAESLVFSGICDSMVGEQAGAGVPHCLARALHMGLVMKNNSTITIITSDAGVASRVATPSGEVAIWEPWGSPTVYRTAATPGWRLRLDLVGAYGAAEREGEDMVVREQ